MEAAELWWDDDENADEELADAQEQ